MEILKRDDITLKIMPFRLKITLLHFYPNQINIVSYL